jgi:hypothetical protein
MYIINKKYSSFKFNVVNEVRYKNPLEMAVAPILLIKFILNKK